MSLLNNLYPPITQNYQASFLRNKLQFLDDEDRAGCDVYFALPSSVTEKEVDKEIGNLGIQMTVVYQNTNITALRTDWYPLGIKVLYNIQINKNVQNDFKYYVRILPQQLKDKEFLKNQHYKVQLRFFNKQGAGLKDVRRYSKEEEKILAQDERWNIETNQSTTLLSLDWLNKSIPYCSEWSSVCVIKGISKPKFELDGFDFESNEDTIIIRGDSVFLKGRTIFEDGEVETLKSYNIKLYLASDKNILNKKNPFLNIEPLTESGDIFTNYYGINEINYQLRYYFQPENLYTIAITYITTNSYKQTKYYDFKVRHHILNNTTLFNITATPNKESGKMIINISLDSKFIGNINIRRTSSKYNYSNWEDVHTTPYASNIEDTSMNYTWEDRTIQSGVWYKYGVQKIDFKGNRQSLIEIPTPVMCIFQDMFLTENDRQLKIMFDPVVNNFKYNVSDTQQITLGSKYPFVTRNSENYYRSFSIGGLITTYIDTSNWYDPHFYKSSNHPFVSSDFHTDEDEIKDFTSKEKLYNDKKELTWGNNIKNYYDNYNSNNNITQENDFIYEREFREKVYDFLYKDNIKLFRTTTEGNMLIKLTDISFQPNATLGRRLYSFTATATEIDEANITNFNKYGIQYIGNWNDYIEIPLQKVFGILQGKFKKDQDLFDVIIQKYKNNNFDIQDESYNTTKYKVSVLNLQYLKLEISGQSFGSSLPCFSLMVNNNRIVIPAKQNINDTSLQYGFLELDNVNITSLKLNSFSDEEPLNITMDYIATLRLDYQTTSKEPLHRYIYTRIGQISDRFELNDHLMKYIKQKYNITKNKYTSYVSKIYNLRFQAPINSILYISQDESQEFQQFVLSNGYLNLVFENNDDENENSNNFITDFYFDGIRMDHAVTASDIINNNILHIKDDEYVTGNPSFNSIEELKSQIVPTKNSVYNINNENYIYYHENFYLFDLSTQTILCPIEGIITYDYNLIKEVYEL